MRLFCFSGEEKIIHRRIRGRSRRIEKDVGCARLFYSRAHCHAVRKKKGGRTMKIVTVSREIKALIPAVAEYVKLWFEQA